jgi:hypothetical protein
MRGREMEEGRQEYNSISAPFEQTYVRFTRCTEIRAMLAEIRASRSTTAYPIQNVGLPSSIPKRLL